MTIAVYHGGRATAQQQLVQQDIILARNCHQGCHISFTSKFSDFSLTFYSFSYLLNDNKKLLLFFTLMVITVSLLIWGLLLKEREQILSYKSSPQ